MATDYYEYDDEFDFGSLPVNQQQEFLYEQIGFVGLPGDNQLHDMFWDVMYNDELTNDQRVEIYDEFIEYLYDEYGIEFADIWDWEAFRDWYETA